MSNKLTRGNALVGAIRSKSFVRSAGESITRSAATVADGASMVASAANIITNTIVSATPTTARNLTTGTAAAIIALSPRWEVGDSSEFTVINLAAATYALTLVGGTGVTIIGSATIAAASSATFWVRIASSSTVVLYRA